jgi:DNA-binding Xre family transcriptional regulator
MSKKIVSTYDEYVQSLTAREKKKFEEGYKDFLLSELLLALMKEDEVSVRELAKAAGISPTIIQGIRSGTQTNLTMQSFLKIMTSLGCALVVEKGKDRFPLIMPHA